MLRGVMLSMLLQPWPMAMGQVGGPSGQSAEASTLQATSTLVLVPVLVRSAAGELVHGLKARDFAVLADGVTQKAQMEATGPVSEGPAICEAG